MTLGDLYQNVTQVRATDTVVVRIQELVLANRLQAGDKLPPERDLAAQFKVSRNVLREALSVLAQKGLITVMPGKGTVVAEPNTDTIRDSMMLLLRLRHVSLGELCDARLLIEPEVAARAAENAWQSDLGELTRRLDDLSNTLTDPAAHVEADLKFHSEIASLARHSVLSTILEAVHEPVSWSMTFGTSVPEAISRSDEHHEAIYRAIVEGNSADARAAMTEHIQFVTDYLRTQQGHSGAHAAANATDTNNELLKKSS